MKKHAIMWMWMTALSILFSDPLLAGSPLQRVQDHVEKALVVLRDPALGDGNSVQEKKKRIWAIVESIFDFSELSKRALGRRWLQFDKRQQEEFTDLFSRLLGDVYMDRILDYQNERVVFDKELAKSEKKAVVKSRIVSRSREIAMDYRMIIRGGEWRVYDVLVEGVSLVRNYKSQFKEILREKSPEELLQIIREKVNKA